MLALKPLFFNTFEVNQQAVVQELSQGLLSAQAACSPKYFYNALGSSLFEAITCLPEYYPTRSEATIFADQAQAIHARLPAQAFWVDLGAGSCQKAARLFAHTVPGVYVAIDISLDYLRGALARLQYEHPQIPMIGVGMDFSKTLEFPLALQQQVSAKPVLAFYPGSSLGNFSPDEALSFLQRIAALCAQGQSGSGLLIGIDLVKDHSVLERAYDDDLGVTAAFNLNALRHINELLGSDFDVRDWRHSARFNIQESRIEMHLHARHKLTVSWPGQQRVFEADESIHTENSYKWTPDKFTKHLLKAGFSQTQHWTDQQEQYAVFWAS